MDANPANSGLESPKNVSIPTLLSPSSPYQSGSGDIPSEFIDAVNYLTLIKAEFSEQPEVYAKFLGILQEWASHPMDFAYERIERIASLFHGHPVLIRKFNAFLPAGYRIETSDDSDPNYVIITPAGVTTQAAAANAALEYTTSMKQPRDILKPAHDFMAQVRARYANQPEVYSCFLAILMETADLHTQQTLTDIRRKEVWSAACLFAGWLEDINVVYQIMDLLKGSVDLMREFAEFLPDGNMREEELARIAELEEARKMDEGTSKRGGAGHALGRGLWSKGWRH